jgi:polysaccharide pyruvyl transferase CsaB
VGCGVGRILLTGYYGFGNIGDEAILSSTVGAIRKKDPSIGISVLSHSPRETKSSYGVETYPRMSLSGVIEGMKSSDLVVFGGGSLLQDTTSFRSLSYYIGLIFAAKILKKPLIVYANGIGPVRSSLGRILVREAISTALKVTVRDYDSRQELISMGVRKDITVTADPAFLLPLPDKKRTDEILSRAGILGKDNIVWLALRPNLAPEWFYREVGKLIPHLRSKGYLPCFLTMQKQDRDVLRNIEEVTKSEILESVPSLEGLMPDEALGVLQRGRFCLGMRLHTLILSARAKVPFLGIAIDPKISAFCKMAGCLEIPNPRTSTPYSLVQHLGTFIEKQDALKAELASKLPKFQALAESNIDIVVDELRKVSRQ